MIDTRFPMRFGTYTLLESLGRGGMAEVFLADYEAIPGTRRLVALKQVLPALAGDPTFVGMFLDEARVLASLYHANLDHVVDVGEVDGVPYLALDYGPGRDLLQVLHRQEAQSALPPELAVHIVSKVLAGLGHAHHRTGPEGRNLGIVHRDVSPENIILGFDGTVKLVDFGIARGEMRAIVTEPGFIKGKPSYMAPEQVLGQAIDQRADIFAVGVLLYRLVVGRHPFRVSGNDEETFRRIVQESPAPPHLVRRGIDDSLSVIILRAMAKNADARPGSADALLAELEGVMAEHRWVGGERQLRERMNQLFPQAAEAARRLATQPSDLAAAREASRYLPESDFDSIETPTGQKVPALPPPPPRTATGKKSKKKKKKRSRKREASEGDTRIALPFPDDDEDVDEHTPTETHTHSLSEVDTLPGEILDGPGSIPPPVPGIAAPRRSRIPKALPNFADTRLQRDDDDEEDLSDIYSDVATHTALRPPGDDSATGEGEDNLDELIDDEPTGIDPPVRSSVSDELGPIGSPPAPRGGRSMPVAAVPPSHGPSLSAAHGDAPDSYTNLPIVWLLGGFALMAIILGIALC